MSRLFVNPYTGQLMDWDTIPDYCAALARPGKYCPVTQQPLDERALELTTYPGPPEYAETWRAEMKEKLEAIQLQVAEPNHLTLGLAGVALDSHVATLSSRVNALEARAAMPVTPAPVI